MQKREVEKPKRQDEEEWEPLVEPIVADNARTMQEQGRQEILSDVQGSYTGSAIDGSEPVQDADDL